MSTPAQTRKNLRAMVVPPVQGVGKPGSEGTDLPPRGVNAAADDPLGKYPLRDDVSELLNLHEPGLLHA